MEKFKEEASVDYKTNSKNISQEVFLVLDKKTNAGNTVTQSNQSYKEFKAIWDEDINLRERFIVLLLNRANKVLGHYVVSTGGFNGTVVDPKLVFIPALLHGASAVILAHNHPSGNLNPSKADISVTKKIVECGKFLDIPVLDHIIITNKSYTSMADENLM